MKRTHYVTNKLGGGGGVYFQTKIEEISNKVASFGRIRKGLRRCLKGIYNVERDNKRVCLLLEL